MDLMVVMVIEWDLVGFNGDVWDLMVIEWDLMVMYGI